MLLTVLPLAGFACAKEPPKAPHDLHPIPEARAADLVERVFRDAGLETDVNRFVEMGKGRRIRLEVAAKGHSYGVAYVTAVDQELLRGAIPPHPEGNDALVVEYGEGHQRYLVLYEQDYAEDDISGEEHTSTTIAADRKLERDVRDFLHRAKTQAWP